MKGDFSRIRFDKEKHYSEVLMQLGRVSVDDDWNEQQAINRHRIGTEAQDVIGKSGAPINCAGFEITAEGNTPETLKLKTEKPGIHVLEVLIPSLEEKPLLNDTEIPFETLSGLVIEFDAQVDSFTFPERPLTTCCPTCFVTLDIPFSLDDTDGKTRVWGFQPLILAAEVKVLYDRILWEPKKATTDMIRKLMNDTANLDLYRNRILARLTLKGNFIWAKNDPEIYLDGEVFGFQEAGKDNIDINLPSGNGRSGGDFEMWFWLFPKGSISGINYDRRSGDSLKDWTIILKRDGIEVGRATTDEEGNYGFIGLDPGTYTIEEVSKDGWVRDKPESGSYSITITRESNNIKDMDFVNHRG